MKPSDLKTRICNTFSQIKQTVSKNISNMSVWEKIVLVAGFIAGFIGVVSGLMTILGFTTGKDLPELFPPVDPITTLEDSTTENIIGENNDKSNDVGSNESDDVDSDESNGVNIDVNIDGAINIDGDENNGVNIVVNASGSDTNEANTNSTEKLTMSRSAYIEELYRAIGSDKYIVTDYYTDYNHDGNFEMFAVVTPDEKIETLYKGTYANREETLPFEFGQVWFVNQDGARNISLTDSHDARYAYWGVFDILLSIGEDKFFPCVKAGTFVESLLKNEEPLKNEEFYTDEELYTDIVYLWGVTPSGEPYQAEFSGYGSDILLNDYNEIELFFSTHDFYFDGCFLGRTWKPYYFYWDGTSFKEYGGILISIDSLYSICGSQKLLEQIDTELKKIVKDVQISEIYYRKNGVININYRCKENNSYYDDYDFDYATYNVTLRYEDKKLKIVSGESDLFREGMYRPALIPQIAIYPDAAFES